MWRARKTIVSFLMAYFHRAIGFALISTPIPPPPPISLPVWSLATRVSEASSPRTSMNIVTYAIAVSISPKLFVISLYHDTMTKNSFLESKRGILQLLTPQQHALVNVLGKHSGYEDDYSKQAECAKLGYDWTSCSLWKVQDDDDDSKLFILPNCALYLELKVKSTIPAGDHELALCEVTQTFRMDDDGTLVSADPNGALDETNVLYTQQLRKMGII